MFTQDEVARRAYEKAEKFRRDQAARVRYVEETTKQNMILSLLNSKVSLDAISKASGWTIDAIRQFAEKNHIQLA